MGTPKDQAVEALREVRDHLYSKQDIARCRELARRALLVMESTCPFSGEK